MIVLSPIFGVALYGIVGDVFEYLPAIARVVRERLGGEGEAED